MHKYFVLLLVVFAGAIIRNDVIEIYYNAEMPWSSFWDVLFVASPAFLFKIIAALVLAVTSYYCLMKNKERVK